MLAGESPAAAGARGERPDRLRARRRRPWRAGVGVAGRGRRAHVSLAVAPGAEEARARALAGLHPRRRAVASRLRLRTGSASRRRRGPERCCRRRLLPFVACASSTPPTGTWAGRSTRGHARRTRRRTSTTCSRSSSPSGSTWSWSRATSTTARCRPSTPCALADETLARLAASRARVVLTSGNHDSAQRLGFSSRLIDAAGVFLRTDAAGRRHARCCSTTTHGPVAVYGLPYLDPDALRAPWGLPAPQPRGGARPRRCAGCAADLAARARHPVGGAGPRVRRRRPRRASPSATSASAASRSCRPSLFDGVDYAALGHLHGRADADRARCATAGPRWPTRSPRPARPRAPGWSTSAPTASSHAELRRGPGPAAAGPAARHARDAAGRPRRSRAPRTPGCRRPSPTPCARRSAMDRLRARFPHALVLALRPRAAAPVRRRRRARVGGRSDHDVALDFVAEVRGARGDHRGGSCCCSSPATPAGRRRRDADVRVDDLLAGARLMRLHHLIDHRLRPVRRHRRRRLRRAQRRRAVPAHRAPPAPASRSLLDAVCFALYGTVPGARGVKTAQVAARRGARRPRGGARRHRAGTPVRGPAQPGVDPPQEARATVSSPRRRRRPSSRRPAAPSTACRPGSPRSATSSRP